MKKFLTAILAASLFCTPVMAADGVKVVVNQNPIDAQAVIVEGRTLVPVRGVFEELGYEVSYDNVTKTATLKRGSSVVEMTNGNTYFTVDGKQVTPDVPQQIIDSRFMLPLRAVGEALEAQVDWDGATKTVTITKSMGLKIVPVQDLTPGEKVNEIVLD